MVHVDQLPNYLDQKLQNNDQILQNYDQDNSLLNFPPCAPSFALHVIFFHISLDEILSYSRDI